MAKHTTVHKLRPDMANGDAARNTLTALIEEAHRQNKRQGSVRAPAGELSSPSHFSGGSNMLPEALQLLLREIVPARRMGDLVLRKEISREIHELLNEVRQTALLRSHSLEPRHTMMLIGPPGTGKTSLAEAVATELGLPFFTVRYDGLVGSYLGETASRLQSVVDYASRTPCVLFFDEFDSVGKERADAHETGEIKRVVSSLLLNMDALPSSCVVVCATNHPELLDRAVWRRFEVRLELPRPGAGELREWYLRTEKALGDLGVTAESFVKMFQGETFSEIEAVTLDARRKVVLSHGKLSSREAFAQALDRWGRRRDVGGAQAHGARSNSTNKPRTRKSGKNDGAATEVPEGDLLGRTVKAP
uniref:ATP-binding protein n=1 Tax=unclassified Rhizobium TaxID=2613769 RepID=UPI000B530773|nr:MULTISPECIES: ATP-binding protein [unclassified Rhizobium]OWW00937.1 ATPase [Rhizobium sp. R72]OWW01316.1 ATPase [Rhizobium sp. R711]